MSKWKIKVIVITLLTLFVVTLAWANYTNSRGLTFDNSGNLLVANGGILAYINSFGFPLDSSGNILVNCASGCGGAGAFADPGSNGTMFRSALNTATVVNGSAVNQIYVAGTSGTGTPSFKSIGDLTPGTYVAGGGTAQLQTATFVPAVTALSTGLQLRFLPAAANTAAAPTLAANGLTATAITKCGTAALVAGDLSTTQPAEVVYDGTEFVLSNPQAIPCGPNTSGAYISTGQGVLTTLSTPANNQTKLWSFVPSVSRSSSTTVSLYIQTADATGADLYNFAIFDATSGNIICQTGAISSTTLGATTTGMKSASWTAACGPLRAGQRYLFGYTAVTTVLALGGTNNQPSPICNVNPTSNNTTASAVFTTPIGIPADSIANCTPPNLTIY